MDNKMLKAFALIAKEVAHRSGIGIAPDWAERVLRIAGAHMAFSNDDEIVACATILTAQLEPPTHAPPTTPSYYTTVPSTARATLHGCVALITISPTIRENGVPGCNGMCPEHDGKRCKLLGYAPETICAPSVQEMAKALAKKH